MAMVRVYEQESWWARPWGVADLDAFQDDVRREVLHGELLVTPAPAPRHALLVARLVTLLSHYCDRERAGVVLAPGVVRWSDNQLEPDIAVFPHGTPIDVPWTAFRRPLLPIAQLLG